MTVETIGARVARVRETRGLTQRALACDGVSHAHISRIERGLREPSVRTLRLLASRLQVSADYLEFGAERAPSADELAVALLDKLPSREVTVRYRTPALDVLYATATGERRLATGPTLGEALAHAIRQQEVAA